MSKNNWQPSASLDTLQLRARMLHDLRAFFAERDVLEVETPVLSRATITDPQLHSFKTQFLNHDYFLHTSPEFFMKRVLAAYGRDIYQVGKVFRDDEHGRYHNPEFTLLEWYRIGFDDHRLMDEVEQLLQWLFSQLAPTITLQSSRRISYRQAFIDSLGIDPLEADCQQLQQITQAQQLEIPQGMDAGDKDMWLDWLLTQCIIPGFDPQVLIFLYDYPASQAALAKLHDQDHRVAHRFEVFMGEMELANGFYELTDADQQALRFQHDNQQRQQQSLPEMPVDHHLLQALRAGMPESAGVALGLDRVLMLLAGKSGIEQVISFDFDRV